MIKKAMQILLVLCILLLSAGGYVHAASEGTPQVLLLYDSLAKSTLREGNIALLQQQLAASGAQVTLLSLDHYERGLLKAYAKVITVMNSPDLAVTNSFYLEDWENYRGDYLHVGFSLPAKAASELQAEFSIRNSGRMSLTFGDFSAEGLAVRGLPLLTSWAAGAKTYGQLAGGGERAVPYAVSKGSTTYASYLEKGNISELAMAYVLRDWLGIAQAPRTYFLVKEVYPFSDLALLENMAERFYAAGIPFMVSVRPVFSNTDYPAMKRYLDALKVVQSRNGSILVQAPAVMPSIGTGDHTLREKMAGFISLLAANGIAPLGIGAEMYWSYDKEYGPQGMGFFDSAVLFPDEKVMYMEQSRASVAFGSSLYSLPLDTLQKIQVNGKAMPAFPLDTAITVNMPEKQAALRDMLQLLDSYWITFADYKQGEHKTVSGNDRITSSHGVLTINGQQLNIEHTPEKVDSTYQYTQEQRQSFARLFSVQNQFFIVAIILSLLLFGGLFAVGYRLYRQKYK